MKSVIIVNGKPTSGKDEFVEMCKRYIIDNRPNVEVIHDSSINPIKQLARDFFGWSGQKSDYWREKLSIIKDIWEETCSGSTEYMLRMISNAPYNSVLFFDVREAKNIDRIVGCIKSLKNSGIKVECTTLLVSRISVDGNVHGNDSDDKVFDYRYDVTVHNDGNLENLNDQAVMFVDNTIGWL